MNNRKYRFFREEKGLLTMRCAVFRQEDGRHCREMPGLSPTKTVVGAMKTVITEMKTVFAAIKRQILI